MSSKRLLLIKSTYFQQFSMYVYYVSTYYLLTWGNPSPKPPGADGKGNYSYRKVLSIV